MGIPAVCGTCVWNGRKHNGGDHASDPTASVHLPGASLNHAYTAVPTCRMSSVALAREAERNLIFLSLQYYYWAGTGCRSNRIEGEKPGLLFLTNLWIHFLVRPTGRINIH